MSDRQKTLEKTAEAIQLLSTTLLTVADLVAVALKIQTVITQARAEGRDISDEELDAARGQSAAADERFAQAVAALKG